MLHPRRTVGKLLRSASPAKQPQQAASKLLISANSNASSCLFRRRKIGIWFYKRLIYHYFFVVYRNLFIFHRIRGF